MTELAFAAIALPLWLWLDDGWWRDAAFVTLVVAGASTLLFNANPLQRLDGYYIFYRRARPAQPRPAQPQLVAADAAPQAAAPARRRADAGGARRGAVAGRLCAARLGVRAVDRGLRGASGSAMSRSSLGLACAALLGWQMVLRPVASQLRQLRRAALAQAASARRWRRHRGRCGAPRWLRCCSCRGRSARWCRVSSGRPNRRSCAPTSRASSAGRAQRRRRGARRRAGAAAAQPRPAGQLARQRARVARSRRRCFDALPRPCADTGRCSRRRCARRAVGRAGRARTAGRARARARGAGAGRRPAGTARRRRPAGPVCAHAAALIGQVLTGDAPIVRVALPESAAAEQSNWNGDGERAAGRFAPAGASGAPAARQRGGGDGAAERGARRAPRRQRTHRSRRRRRPQAVAAGGADRRAARRCRGLRAPAASASAPRCASTPAMRRSPGKARRPCSAKCGSASIRSSEAGAMAVQPSLRLPGVLPSPGPLWGLYPLRATTDLAPHRRALSGLSAAARIGAWRPVQRRHRTWPRHL